MAEVGRLARRCASLLCALTVCGAAAQVTFLVAAGVPLLSREALDQTFPIVTVAVVVGAMIGAVIVGRYPRHRVGWLFCIGQAGASVGLAAQAMTPGVLTGRIPLPMQVGQIAGWLGAFFGASYALTLVGLLLLLVPNGRLPSRRWRPAAGLLIGGYLLTAGGLLLIPPSRFAANGPQEVHPLAIALLMVGQLAVTVGLVGAAWALVVRLRRARGEERQQLRWIAAAAALLAAAVVAIIVDGRIRGINAPSPWYLQALLYLGYLTVPIATGFAVLRYRLYDIDLIIRRTVRLAALAAFVTAGYVAAVVVIGSVVAGSAPTVWPSLVAYVVVALAFQPLRQRVARFADRIVYGDRAAPYDSLAEFSRQLTASGLSEPELLRLVARCSALAVGADAARVTVHVPGGEDLSARWPQDANGATGIGVPVSHQGEVLGRIELRLRPEYSLTRSQRRLVEQLATQTALAFRNVRLTAALRQRAEALGHQRVELAASRRRLLTAADTERQRVATAINTEVAVHLTPLPQALADLKERLPRDPARVQTDLERLQQSTARAIDALRTITAGVLPPLLGRRGLAAAVQAYATQSPTAPTVILGPDTSGQRFEPSVEAAAYHVCIQAIDGLARGSEVKIETADNRLLISVRGRPGSGLPDSQQVLDRLEAVGGQLEDVDSIEGDAVFCAVLPLDPNAQAAANRSGPNTDFRM